MKKNFFCLFHFLGLGYRVAQATLVIERITKFLLSTFFSGEDNNDHPCPPALEFFGRNESIHSTVHFLDLHKNEIDVLIKSINRVFHLTKEDEILMGELESFVKQFILGRDKKCLDSKRAGQRGG